MSRWGDIYKHLKMNGIEVYSPGQHQGECLSPYVVVKVGDTLPVSGTSSIRTLYDILCYVPESTFSKLEHYVDQVDHLMKGLEPGIRSTHYRTPAYLDPEVKGHMISMQYYNYKKL